MTDAIEHVDLETRAKHLAGRDKWCVSTGEPGRGEEPGRGGDICFTLSGGVEILRFASEGSVYVRGKQVDDNRAIYDAFKAWLAQAWPPVYEVCGYEERHVLSHYSAPGAEQFQRDCREAARALITPEELQENRPPRPPDVAEWLCQHKGYVEIAAERPCICFVRDRLTPEALEKAPK